MEKNQEYTDIVLGMGMDGEGVLKRGDTTVFVPYSIVGEKISYKVLKVSKNVAYGKVLEVFSPAENRVRPKCPIFTKCGGCDLQHLNYNSQLKIKENKIKTCFSKIAHVDVEVKKTVKSEEQFRYRNKLQLPVGQTDKGTLIGFYANNSHRIVPIDDCFINPEWTACIIKCFKEYIEQNNLKGYNELNNTGDVREITVKQAGGSLIITVVILKDNLPKLDGLINLLKSNLKQEFSLYLNINNKKGNFVYGENFKLVYGEGQYYSIMQGVKYLTGVRSFSQVNDNVCEKLYRSDERLVCRSRS